MVGFEERVFSTAKSQHGFFKKKKTISQIKSQSEMETNGVPTNSRTKNEKTVKSVVLRRKLMQQDHSL